MLSTIVLIPLVLLSQWIPISRSNGSLPRLFLSKLEVIITFFELCGKRISHLWTLHIRNLSSWTLLKTQNFPLFSQNFWYTVLWSDFIRWYHNVLFFPQQNYLVMSGTYFLVQIYARRCCSNIHLINSQISMHQCHYDSKRILSWDCIKCLIISYPFLCINPFATSHA